MTNMFIWAAFLPVTRVQLRQCQSMLRLFESIYYSLCFFFFSRNAVKKKGLVSFMAAILYACESWLNVGVKKMGSVYMYTSALKSLLGVRVSNTNDLCLVE